MKLIPIIANEYCWIGLSTEDKPTSKPIGSRLWLRDTKETFIVGDDGEWTSYQEASNPVLYKYEEEIDVSGGGTNVVEPLITLEAGRTILDIIAYCTETFDGDTTRTFEIGIDGNTDRYIDPVDCPVTLGGITSMITGTNNDQQDPEVLASDTSIQVKWTNTADTTTGKMKVKVIFI